jgi:hypothetical protein
MKLTMWELVLYQIKLFMREIVREIRFLFFFFKKNETATSSTKFIQNFKI